MRSLRRVTLFILIVLVSANVALPSDSPERVISPTDHECFLFNTSCGATVTDATDAFTCRTTNGYYYDLWRFQANAGDRVTIQASSFAYRVVIDLFDTRNPSNPVLMASVVANAPGLGASMTFIVPGTGLYTIALGANAVAATGTYTFSITCSAGPAPGSCVSSTTTACVLNNRFRVSVRYRAAFDNQAATTPALVKAVSGFANPAFETAFFYFNDANNIEMLVKLLDQGNTNSQGQRTIAVLFGSATPLRIEMDVTDTTTGAVRQYLSEFGQMRGATDFTAFVK
jgi:hypothetical protein